MRKISPTARAVPRTRFRGTVMTMLVMALSVLIVRDILARRWSTPPAAPDVTRRLP
ncbi:hypothetical protein [Bradyrhizobium erythrophlei]|uniref:hypothetical protein n=1 Tax=Bradyrhizobium erythrophlei TaxID=1437360 RepID=UPI00155F9664|nr:hypothetical protein [Bradyrhizobium erythrophlei]